MATEMVFSRAGAAQLSTDVAALLRCFAPWTPKPQSHFKELLEATRLLGLEQGQVAALQQVRGRGGCCGMRVRLGRLATQRQGQVLTPVHLSSGCAACHSSAHHALWEPCILRHSLQLSFCSVTFTLRAQQVPPLL